ncbi:MAG: glycosyltransferase family 4 protein [Steroidobacteraceae bacterium]
MTVGKTRVLFVNRFFYPDESATSQLLSDVAFGFAESGMEVHVVCSRQHYGIADARLPTYETIRGVTVHRIWTTRFGRDRLIGRGLDYMSFYMSCTVALLRLLRTCDILVAKTDPPMISIVAAIAAKCKNAILVNWLQDIFPEVASTLGTVPLLAPLYRILRYWRDASLRSARVNVVIGLRMKEYLIGRGIPAGRICVIENWAIINTACPTPPHESRLRLSLGLDEHFVVAYSGNLGRAHDYTVFGEAALAFHNDQQVQFLFIGGGVHMDALQKMVQQRHLSNVHFLPYQPRAALADTLACAEVHLVSLSPALEGFVVPSKFYGIVAAGRPVVFVGDPDGELSRIIRAAQCGLVVRAGDAAGLAAAINHLKEHPDQRAAMGTAARELVSGRFDSSQAMKNWVALVTSVQAAASGVSPRGADSGSISP